MKRDTRPKGRQIDLGLAISGATMIPGQVRELPEIAAFCGCSKQLIFTIEQSAIRKIRKALGTEWRFPSH
jgi:hypothetical protein